MVKSKGDTRIGRSTSRRRGSSGSISWFGVNPWIVIGGAVVLVLILLFVPMFPATKATEVTDTKMVTVETQVPETVTEDVPTKVYVGYMQEQGQTYGGYMPPIIIYSVGGDSGMLRGSADYGPSYGPSYSPYGNSGRRYQIDASDEIVDFQQANGPDGSLTITLTSASGKSTVYRYIDRYDMTKTGEVNIRTTITRTKTVSTQEPQQVTTVEGIPIRVNLIHVIKDAVNNGTRMTVLQYLKQLNDAYSSFSDSLDSPAISAKMNSQDPNTLISGFQDAKQKVRVLEDQLEELTPTTKVPELAELKYCAFKVAFAFDSLFDHAITAIQTGDMSKISQLGTEMIQIADSPDLTKIEQLTRSLQLKYNITDAETESSTSPSVGGSGY
jgi:hypothetical protein